MGGDQFPVDRAFLQVGFVVGGEIEQRVAKGVGGEAGDVGAVAFFGRDQLFDEAGLGCRGLNEHGLGLGFLEPAGLNEGACQAAEGRGGGCGCHPQCSSVKSVMRLRPNSDRHDRVCLFDDACRRRVCKARGRAGALGEGLCLRFVRAGLRSRSGCRCKPGAGPESRRGSSAGQCVRASREVFARAAGRRR